MLAARALGLHTCPQAAWNNYAKIVMPFIDADANEMLVCGMAIGYADEFAPVNAYRTPREEVESFTRWV
ncbi:Nitroreductase family protein [compost metagenome]